jgi:hypothetical protein
MNKNNNLVNEEAYKRAFYASRGEGWESRGKQLWAALEAYETAKLELAKEEYVDDREASCANKLNDLAQRKGLVPVFAPDYSDKTNKAREAAEKQFAKQKPQLPELPEQVAGYWGDDTTGRALKDVFRITNALTVWAIAVTKHIEGK